MKAIMKHPIDDIIAFVSGTFGGSLYMVIAGITWQSFFDSALQMLWVGFVAAFTGAMGVVGKHMIGKYINKKKK